MADEIRWGDLMAVARTEPTGRLKADTFATNPRGHNWMHSDGVILHYLPRARGAWTFSARLHTGGPYCARCERVFCISCENPYGQRCDALREGAVPLPAGVISPFGGGAERICYEEDE